MGGRPRAFLLESKTKPNGMMDYVIVGTGINIATYPETTDGLPATSLSAVGAEITVAELLSAYAYTLLDLYMIWKREGFAPIREQWLERATGVGERIVARLFQRDLGGCVFSDLDENGALVLGSGSERGKKADYGGRSVYSTPGP